MATEFVKVASKGDLGPGEMKQVTVSGEEICLVNLDGEYLAIGNVCTHVGGSLHEGMLEGDEVECPLHGSRFNARTGEVAMPPAAEPVKAFAVRVEGDDVLVGPK